MPSHTSYLLQRTSAYARRVAVLCFAVSLVACASSSALGGKTQRSQTTLLVEEIRSTQYTNLYDVILALRSNWVRVRTGESFTKSAVLQVYLDQQRIGGVDELKGIQTLNVEMVRFFDGPTASARWGLDHGAGAILVQSATPLRR
jgi:hypothetical protein